MTEFTVPGLLLWSLSLLQAQCLMQPFSAGARIRSDCRQAAPMGALCSAVRRRALAGRAAPSGCYRRLCSFCRRRACATSSRLCS